MNTKTGLKTKIFTGAAITCSLFYFLFVIDVKEVIGKINANDSKASSPIADVASGDDASQLRYYDAKRISAYSKEKLLREFDSYVDRLIAGDEVSGKERMDMIWRIEAAVQFSPELRAALKQRLESAIEKGEYMAVLELEQGFDTSEIGSQTLLEAYSNILKTGGELDWHALQSASYKAGGLTDSLATDYFNGAFSQLGKYQDFERANGAMRFLSVAAAASQDIPDATRGNANELMKSRLLQARTEDDQYFTAKYLYKMYNATDSARLAESIVRQRQTYPIARATLDAIVNGRMYSSPALIDLLISVAGRSDISGSERATLTSLLTQATAMQNHHG
jgi:hypothetical protein